jgi:hypothetical protein
MPTRPTWAGSIQISLVSIAVKIFPATNPGKQIQFHQIDRKTHKRVHHQNVDEAGKVEKTDVIKGFEYAKDKYIEIDPEELKHFAFRRQPPCLSVNLSTRTKYLRDSSTVLILWFRKMRFRRRRSASCAKPSRKPTPSASARLLLAAVNTSWQSELLWIRSKRA